MRSMGRHVFFLFVVVYLGWDVFFLVHVNDVRKRETFVQPKQFIDAMEASTLIYETHKRTLQLP